ncbi:MAG: TolC family protein [Longimicrobiales bacterium]|nr:TolC family protein [Longimicrobiales bacterium]
MKPEPLRRRLRTALVAAALAWPGAALTGPAAAAAQVQVQRDHRHDTAPTPDTLRLAVVVDSALARNPELLALRALADAAAARVPEAGTLPDPTLTLGAMNLGLFDLDRGMPNSMAPSVQLSQTLPFFGKLRLREEMADATGEEARVTVAESEWRLRGRVAEEFHALYALDQRLAVQQRTLELLQDFQSVARALYASGTGNQGDVIRADVEVARLDAEMQRLQALRAVRAASLNALLDRPGGAQVGTLLLDPVPEAVPAPETLLAWAMETRPALIRESVRVERARTGVELAERDFWPDFTVSAQFGRRGGENARSMGSLLVGASLPIHAGSRQRPRVEAARAMERAAEAGASGVRAAVDAELRTVLADLRRAGSLMTLHRDEIIPAAQANVNSSLASYRVGAVDFATLVDAQLAVDRFEQDYHQLVADYCTALSQLEAVVGRPLPGTEILPAAFAPEVP